MIRFLLTFFITVYQKTVSPSTGLPYKLGFVKVPVCRFLPTCSQYTKEAIQKHGVIKGLSLGAKRISRCRPGLPPEYDPIPESL